MPKAKKIVYILGAGFSKPCGIPEQKEILPEILAKTTNPLLKNFLIKFFGHSKNIPLEDIFTALDKSINNNAMLHNFGIEKLVEIRNKFNKSIIELFNETELPDQTNYLNKFANQLLTLRKSANDPLGIISTNWDAFLDNAIESVILENCINSNQRNTYIDYCTFTHSLDSSNTIPSTRIKALGYTNIKLLKLHGSVNWWLCPNCDSLYFKLNANAVFQKNRNSIYCKGCYKNHGLRFDLRTILISPTFLKDFNNVHLRTIWWNAGFELSEATHIIFIGYSLPLSDFELRYLFARFIPKAHIKIKVILFSENSIHPNIEAMGTAKRYVNFFGNLIDLKRDVSFRGVENYVKHMDKVDLFW